MSAGGGQADPLLELWLRMRRVLAPFGVAIERAHLDLWRDQAAHGYGPLYAAERGDTEAVEELVGLLRLLADAGDAQAGKGDAPVREA